MNKLKEIIHSEQIDVDKLANDIGISPDHLQSWIDGKEKPTDEDEQNALIEALKLQTANSYLIDQLFYEVALLVEPKWGKTTMKYYGGGDPVPLVEPFGDKDQLRFIIDQGTAPDEKIADLLSDFSILYRMTGGSGINFETSGIILTAGHE